MYNTFLGSLGVAHWGTTGVIKSDYDILGQVIFDDVKCFYAGVLEMAQKVFEGGVDA